MIHHQSPCLGNRCSILLGSPERLSKICLLGLCSWRTRGWSIYFQAALPHWLKVVLGRIDTMTLVGRLCLCAGQGAPTELAYGGRTPSCGGMWSGWEMWITDMGGGCQRHLLQKLSMKCLWGGKVPMPESSFFVLYWVPAVRMGIAGFRWFLVESINECTNS